MIGVHEALRTQVRAALRTAGISQAKACRQLGLTTKHMSRMLTGRAPLTLDWAEQILDLCGIQIVIGIHSRGRPMAGPRLTASNITDPALTSLYNRLEAALRHARQAEWEAALAERHAERNAADTRFAVARAERAEAALDQPKDLRDGAQDLLGKESPRQSAERTGDRPPFRRTFSMLIVLRHLLRNGRTWGLEISKTTGLKSGTVYPILHRLRGRGWVEVCGEASSHPGRPARYYYQLTPVGRTEAAATLDQPTEV